MSYIWMKQTMSMNPSFMALFLLQMDHEEWVFTS